MPSESISMQEQGFRSSLFGFDKNDVLAYMNALANEAQQHEMEQQQKLQQLQAQVDGMRAEHDEACTRAEALAEQLRQAEERAGEAERRYQECKTQLETEQQRSATFQSGQKESQKNANIWQLKCHDLQQQLQTLQGQLQQAVQARPAAPAAVPAPAPAPAGDPKTTQEARTEARRILADAHLYAETAERELKEQAAQQKARMAENARGIAVGVLVLRDRLARVDEKLNAASLDLEQATASIYQALDATEEDLRVLGTEMRNFTHGTPESDPPRAAEPPQAAPAPAQRTKVPAQRLHRVSSTAPVPRNRLRSVRKHPVSQLLQQEMDRLER